MTPIVTDDASGEIAAGISGPKKGIVGPISGKMRFPDRLTTEVLKEVKNVKYQGWTAQLKDYAAIAKKFGVNFELWIRKSTVTSKVLDAAAKAKDVIIKYFNGK